MFKRKLAVNRIGTMLGFCLLFTTMFPKAWADQGSVDVYVAYSGKNKADKNALKKAFRNDISVKFYNVDLLAVADYSGKQKAIGKFERAKIIVILKDSPMELLQGAKLNTDLIIVQSVKNSVQSEKLNLYLVSKGTDLTALGGRAKTHNASNEGDLSDAGVLRSLDVVLVDETSLDINKAVDLIVNKLLGY